MTFRVIRLLASSEDLSGRDGRRQNKTRQWRIKTSARSHKFNIMEVTVVYNEVIQNPIQETKFTYTLAHQRKQVVWKIITKKVNAVVTTQRSVTEVKHKWRTRNVSETYMPPLVQNSKLLQICTRHYEFRTLYKAELNIIK